MGHPLLNCHSRWATPGRHQPCTKKKVLSTVNEDQTVNNVVVLADLFAMRMSVSLMLLLCMLASKPAMGSSTASGWAGWASLRPIGAIRSIYATKFGTPRQGSVVPDALATLTLDCLEDIDAYQALDGLGAYSHVWLLWAAHLNQHDAKQAKVRAPHLRGSRTGLFSTRSPFRPNPIGLSLVRLEAIQGNTLRLSGVDLVDGTPVLDIKPYLPQYDAPKSGVPICTAEWVDPPPLNEVVFTPEAEGVLEEFNGARAASRNGRTLMNDAAQLRRALVQTLAADPRPLYRWRREQDRGAAADTEYDVSVDGLVWRCRFERCDPAEDTLHTTVTERVTVLGLRPSPSH